jgi:hypothetical protein
MVKASGISDDVVIALPCNAGNPCDSCREEIRVEALLWLRELSESSGPEVVRVGRAFSTLSSSVRVLHQCQPPQAYLAKEDAATWSCPNCGIAWRFRLLAEGQSFGANGGLFLWGEWVPEAVPRQQS